MDVNDHLFSEEFVNISRESLPFLNWSSNFENPGRESFGQCRPSIARILSLTKDNFVDIGRESLPRLNSDIMDGNRESLGLLRPNNWDFANVSAEFLDDSVFAADVNLPQILVESAEASGQAMSNPLNTAFLQPRSIISSSSVISFNSQSTVSGGGDPSPIYSLSHASKFNEAFLMKMASEFNLARSTTTTDDLVSKFARLRIKSLPAILEKTHEMEKSHVADEGDDNKGDSSLNELVIAAEAEHLAFKIADGSILDTSYAEANLLDSIPQPEWEDFLDGENKEENPKPKVENVFELVDKMIGTMKPMAAGDSNTSQASSNGTTSSLSRNDFFQNLSNIFVSDSQRQLSTSQTSDSRRSKSKSRSRDAKNILHNLSEIFDAESRSNEQKVEGQNLIMCLADMLCCSDKSKNEDCSEDSGHSSIETENLLQKCNVDVNRKVLSQSFGGSPNNDNSNNKKERTAELLLLEKSSEETMGAKRNRSMSVSSLDKKNVKRLVAGGSGSNLSKFPALGKLKPRRSESVISSRKGPMKAVLPINRMSKFINQGEASIKLSTPPKSQQPMKKKCTSTPIEEFKLNPVAQSTPGSGQQAKNLKPPQSGQQQQQQRKFDYSVSPLSRPNISASASKINRSGSDQNLSTSVETASSKTNKKRRPGSNPPSPLPRPAFPSTSKINRSGSDQSLSVNVETASSKTNNTKRSGSNPPSPLSRPAALVFPSASRHNRSGSDQSLSVKVETASSKTNNKRRPGSNPPSPLPRPTVLAFPSASRINRSGSDQSLSINVETASSKTNNKKSGSNPPSPLSRPAVAPKNAYVSSDKMNHSGSEPNLSGDVETTASKLNQRRKSANDLKNETKPIVLKRSFSIGQAREKMNVLKASNYGSRIAVLNENYGGRNSLNMKPINLMSKLRANGKENAGV